MGTMTVNKDRFVTENSSIPGPLQERATEFLVSLLGQSLSEMDGRQAMKQRVMMGVFMEFGIGARVEFPSPRDVHIIFGRKMKASIGICLAIERAMGIG